MARVKRSKGSWAILEKYARRWPMVAEIRRIKDKADQKAVRLLMKRNRLQWQLQEVTALVKEERTLPSALLASLYLIRAVRKHPGLNGGRLARKAGIPPIRYALAKNMAKAKGLIWKRGYGAAAEWYAKGYRPKRREAWL